ncbi:MAG TPA: elongation factor G, partial [Magnetospirillaceae bacterium]|nr:elongation factor G [Magnetospirillaceae bacterium]
IHGMGELHLDVLVTRIMRDFRVDARVGNPQVTYRESVTRAAEHTESYRRVFAGRENVARLTLRVEPRPRGEGNLFRREARGAGVPREIWEAVETAVTNAFGGGIQYGYPCTDVGVTLLGLEWDELTSTPFAFQAAASQGFDEACRKAAPVLLEPIMKVDIFTPKDFLGETLGLVSQRGGIIHGTESKAAVSTIHAEAPMAAMFGFMTALRSVTQGRAGFSMEFSHFQPEKG